VARASYEVTAESVKFLGGRGESGDVPQGGEPEEPNGPPEDEIPF
jgi:hypothetical protein